jgi:hypothetical protein
MEGSQARAAPSPVAAAAQLLTDAQEAKLGCLPLKKTKLSCDWRADAQILSHCWPEQFPESHMLQQGQPTEPSLQINYGAGMSEVL